VEIVERRERIGELEVHWRQAGDAPLLYLHGVPTASFDWVPFLELGGGIAPDLPGFGHSAKPAEFDYSIDGYADFLEGFVGALGLERVSLVMHDWGVVGLALAQRRPELVERLVMFNTVPFLPGYRWHRVARGWRRPLVGELMMGAATRWAFRRELPAELADQAWGRFDHGTQRAILKLYRSARPICLRARASGSTACRARRSCCGRPTTRTSLPASGRRTRTRSADPWSSSSWTAGIGPGSTGPSSCSARCHSWLAPSASLLQPCSGPRSPQSRRRLVASPARSRPAPAVLRAGRVPDRRNGGGVASTGGGSPRSSWRWRSRSCT